MPANEKDILYKLWLNEQLKYDHYKIDRAVRLFDSAEDIYKMKRFDTRKIKHLGLTSVFNFNNKDLDFAKRIVEECHEKGISMISMDDKEYPQRLRQIEGHPSIIYVKGKLPDIDNMVAVTIVGTRRCTRYGADMAHDLAFDLSKCGVLVISGMAEGIDSCAHRGALDANCPTVAVLAGGVDVIYPRSNEMLYSFIQNNGAVIAEEPPGSLTIGYKFPIRNRIMAALAMGVVIVEGSNKSGAKHTAARALDYGKDVFALPHNADSRAGELPNRLISEGAKITRNALDVINEYIGEYPQLLSHSIQTNISANKRREYYSHNNNAYKEPAKAEQKANVQVVAVNIEDTEKFKTLNNTEQIIVKYIYGKNSVHIDEIIRGCSLDAGMVNSAVMLLQMKGIVTELPGKCFVVKSS